MNEVSPDIFIGDSHNAEDTKLLESHCITHVVSVELEKPDVDNKFKHLYIKMYDEPHRDLLGHLKDCFEFIDEGLKDGKVLIHW